MRTVQYGLIIGIVLFVFSLYSGNPLLFSQNSTQLPTSAIPTETINIVKPVATQNVSIGDELKISGQSSDNNLKNCSVSVIVNNLKPYQNAVAKGPGGSNDFSQWEFVLSNNYTHVINGQNKITSKLLCPTELTRWFSVVVNGVSGDSIQQEFSPVQENIHQNTPVTNSSASNDLSPAQENVQQNTPVTNSSNTDYIDTTKSTGTNDIDTTKSTGTNDIDTTKSTGTNDIDTTKSTGTNDIDTTKSTGTNDIDTTKSTGTNDIDTTKSTVTNNIDSNNNEMLVSISVEKNPVGRGDRQNSIITVTDSSSLGIANAKIDGKLIYPGNNYEKKFNGITDSQGKFVYSWIIGKKGDVGPLSMEVEVFSQGFPPSSATSSFEIVDK